MFRIYQLQPRVGINPENVAAKICGEVNFLSIHESPINSIEILFYVDLLYRINAKS